MYNIFYTHFIFLMNRKPDEIEIIVKKSGYMLPGKRQRYIKSGQVGVIEYTV